MKRKKNGKKWGLPGLAAVLLVLMGCVSGAAPTAEAQEVPAPQAARFADVTDNAWYATSVYQAAKSGLMVGVDGTHFAPDDTMTAAQAVTMAARLHRQKLGDGKNFSDSRPWYQSYVDYARKSGLLTGISISNYDQPIRRSQVAALFARSLPKKELSEQNRVTCLPDVDAGHPYASEIFSLYRAGVLTGNDSKGTFAPDDLFTRAQAAAIAVRLQNPGWRKQFQLNIVDSISREQRREIQETISQFNDAHTRQFDRETASNGDLIWFGFTYAIYEDLVTRVPTTDLYYTHDILVDPAVVDYAVQRYIGEKTVVRETTQTSDGIYTINYQDGFYRIGEGQGAELVAIILELYDLGNGRYRVLCTDYAYVDRQPNYGLTFAEAEAMWHEYGCGGMGVASESIVEKAEYQGREVYHMVNWRDLPHDGEVGYPS